MDFSSYFVVPSTARATVEKLFEPERLVHQPGDRFMLVVSGDRAKAAKLDVVLDFHNDEWSAWGFTVLAKGNQIAHGLFGENAETGVDLEDNCLEGDLAEAARLLAVPEKKLRTVVEAEEPNVDDFVKVVGFALFPITSHELDSHLKKQTSRSTTKPASKTKAQAKAKAQAQPKAKAKPNAKAKAKPIANAKAKPIAKAKPNAKAKAKPNAKARPKARKRKPNASKATPKPKTKRR